VPSLGVDGDEGRRLRAAVADGRTAAALDALVG